MLSRKLLVLLILANFLFICVHQSFFGRTTEDTEVEFYAYIYYLLLKISMSRNQNFIFKWWL